MRKFIFLAVWLGVSCSSGLLRAEDTYNIFIQKQEKKEKARWSISDWLETRDKMRLQDLWFALHSPSPYEFYVSGLYKTGNIASGGSYHGWNLIVAGYAYLFGLEMQRHWSSVGNRWLALVNFRLFGVYNQATNITIQAGAISDPRFGTDVWNAAVGAHMTLYLSKGFGVTGVYRYRLPRAAAVSASGWRGEVGAFIDFKMVRVFGEYFSENENNAPQLSYNGLQLGVRVYL